jgi:hypothetical protein
MKIDRIKDEFGWAAPSVILVDTGVLSRCAATLLLLLTELILKREN